MDSIHRQHKEKTWTGFLYSIFGVTLPFFLSLLGILVIQRYEKIISFFDDGQVLLFSVGLLASAFYIFRDDENQKSIKKSKFKCDRVFSHLNIIFLIVTSVIYAILYTIQILNLGISVNIWFIRVSSLILFVLSAFSVYRSIYIDFIKVYPNVDVKKESQHEIDNLINQL